MVGQGDTECRGEKAGLEAANRRADHEDRQNQAAPFDRFGRGRMTGGWRQKQRQRRDERYAGGKRQQCCPRTGLDQHALHGRRDEKRGKCCGSGDDGQASADGAARKRREDNRKSRATETDASENAAAENDGGRMRRGGQQNQPARIKKRGKSSHKSCMAAIGKQAGEDGRDAPDEKLDILHEREAFPLDADGHEIGRQKIGHRRAWREGEKKHQRSGCHRKGFAAHGPFRFSAFDPACLPIHTG